LLEEPPCRGIWQEFLADDLARANWQVAMEATSLLAIMATLVVFLNHLTIRRMKA
jgi:hypothetical protein